MVAKASPSHTISTEEVRIVSVDFSQMLSDGERLTGVPSVQSTAGINFTGITINPTDVEINGTIVEPNCAVQMFVSSTMPVKYVIEIVCTTTGGQTIEGILNLTVKQTLY